MLRIGRISPPPYLLSEHPKMRQIQGGLSWVSYVAFSCVFFLYFFLLFFDNRPISKYIH